jgi:16S rRNA (guanine527-N7)-methyltransferase
LYLKAMPEEFSSALEKHAPRFGLQLDASTVATLESYYKLVQTWNARLHLVAPCSPAEFATRHVLESLIAIEYMKENARVADIGSGAGLPIIPCLIARRDIQATLIEASQKKAIFLREALREIAASDRAQVLSERFEQIPEPAADLITCRALDRFTATFSKILDWSPRASTLLFFGGPSLRTEIEKARLSYKAIKVPESEQRFLFIIERQREV